MERTDTSEDDYESISSNDRDTPVMAPLSVPLERRIQTFATLIYGTEPCILFGLFIYLFTLPVLWPLLIAYIIWMIVDKAPYRGGRKIVWFRKLRFWKWFADYFPVNIIKVKIKGRRRKIEDIKTVHNLNKCNFMIILFY